MSQSEVGLSPLYRNNAEKDKAEIRADFMKRWFAIALSVGFATALSRMPWIEKGLIAKPELPIDYEQINQALRLMAATAATLLSWEGYLNSIRTKPLTDGIRFYIDVLLVTIYLVLLLTSASQHFWIWLHFSTFVIYIFWDFVSIGVHRHAYIISGDVKDFSRRSIYKYTILGNAHVRHGPLVTLIWPIYLLTIAVCYQTIFTVAERGTLPVTALYFSLVVLGLLGYRGDKARLDRSPFKRFLRVVGASLIALFLSLGLDLIGERVPAIYQF